MAATQAYSPSLLPAMTWAHASRKRKGDRAREARQLRRMASRAPRSGTERSPAVAMSTMGVLATYACGTKARANSYSGRSDSPAPFGSDANELSPGLTRITPSSSVCRGRGPGATRMAYTCARVP